MIRPEQVVELRPGDVVELREDRWPKGACLRGPLSEDEYGNLVLSLTGDSHWVIRYKLDNGLSVFSRNRTLAVVSRAPRPLYVNHPRTEPAAGDVVREDGTDRACTWVYEDPSDADEPWRHILGQLCGTHQVRWTRPSQMPARLRLLVDGTTGQAVTP